MAYACIAHSIQNNLYENFLKFGKCYVKYIIYVCMRVFVCASAYAPTHAHAHAHKHTHTHTTYLFSDDIKLCDNRQVLQSPVSQQVIRRIKSRSFP
jgi:hypothetical protein